MKVKLIDFGYTLKPKRAHANDAGADVYIKDPVTIAPQTTARIPLGFGIELPDGYAGYIFPRSSMAARGIVCELPPIDSGYRGEIHAIVSNVSDEHIQLKAGERVGQLVVMPVVIVEYIDYDIEQRGAGAFGSTGK